jgi:Golgi phosphoprotein 3
MKKLLLHEEILLLALKDEEGTTYSGTGWPYAAGGAVLAELLLEGRLRLEDHEGKKHLAVVNATPLGEPIADQVLEMVASAKKTADMTTWLGRVAGLKDLKHQIAEQLVLKGVLQVETHKVMLIFSQRIYPKLDPAPELEIMHRVEHAVFSDDSNLDARTAILVSLAHVTGILDPVFGSKRVTARRDRLDKIAEDWPSAEAARAAIEATRAAMAAIMAATVAINVATH